MATDTLQAWVVSMNMGLGHMRASHPLQDIAYGGVHLLGEEGFSSDIEVKNFRKLTKGYEFISRFKKIPVVGALSFSMLDRFLFIHPLYPVKDRSKPNFQTNLLYGQIKKGLGKAFMDKIYSEPLPLVSSYPMPALIADYYNYPRNYCIVTDAEITRGWVPKHPRQSKIIYFASCGRARQRLNQYGIPDERIFITGYPLPKSLLGSEDLDILKSDIGQRLHYLDPGNRFWPLHKLNVAHFLGKKNISFKKERVLSLTYAVGGAGALAEIGIAVAQSLRPLLLEGKMKLNLVAGRKRE
ncbi:MAG TPA: hypothetical protein ENN69_03905, partial [Spirochaetia bacterium]|nr:hypothetical protein [Spirochaetia bacterium]